MYIIYNLEDINWFFSKFKASEGMTQLFKLISNVNPFPDNIWWHIVKINEIEWMD